VQSVYTRTQTPVLLILGDSGIRARSHISKCNQVTINTKSLKNALTQRHLLVSTISKIPTAPGSLPPQHDSQRDPPTHQTTFDKASTPSSSNLSAPVLQVLRHSVRLGVSIETSAAQAEALVSRTSAAEILALINCRLQLQRMRDSNTAALPHVSCCSVHRCCLLDPSVAVELVFELSPTQLGRTGWKKGGGSGGGGRNGGTQQGAGAVSGRGSSKEALQAPRPLRRWDEELKADATMQRHLRLALSRAVNAALSERANANSTNVHESNSLSRQASPNPI